MEEFRGKGDDSRVSSISPCRHIEMDTETMEEKLAAEMMSKLEELKLRHQQWESELLAKRGMMEGAASQREVELEIELKRL